MVGAPKAIAFGALGYFRPWMAYSIIFKIYTPLWKIYRTSSTGVGVSVISNGSAVGNAVWNSHPSVQYIDWIYHRGCTFHIDVSSGLFHLKFMVNLPQG